MTKGHCRLMARLKVAFVIDVRKPASLGFVVPGMKAEYEISKTMVAWLPCAALCGTVVGSVVWGLLADIYGRRASILLSAVMFVGTAICGAMRPAWPTRGLGVSGGRGSRRGLLLGGALCGLRKCHRGRRRTGPYGIRDSTGGQRTRGLRILHDE